MPRLQKCPTAGCRVLVERGRCGQHERERQRETDQRRGNARQRGYGVRWDRASAAFRCAHPLCAVCELEGRLTAAECVDHIVPHRGDPVLFWNQNNWQSLCWSCHSRKTAREGGGFTNR